MCVGSIPVIIESDSAFKMAERKNGKNQDIGLKKGCVKSKQETRNQSNLLFVVSFGPQPSGCLQGTIF